MLRLLAVLSALACLTAPAMAQDEGRPGVFDFYVLALSWSPTYCETDGRRDREQCAPGEDHAFVVHGLWPQHERGYPQFCPGPSTWVEAERAREMADLMPSRDLVFRQWRKHGTCSGLNQTAYFDLVREAHDRVVQPRPLRDPARDIAVSADALEAAFVSANRGLRRDMLAVRCDAGLVEEVRVCLDKRLNFRACPDIDRRGCAQGSLTMPAPD